MVEKGWTVLLAEMREVYRRDEHDSRRSSKRKDAMPWEWGASI